jgi:TonB-dependent SusC/RagA subfamily outer membrane receptor
MTTFSTRVYLLAALLGAGQLALGQVVPHQYLSTARSDAWIDSVRRLPLPQQLAAVHQRMLGDTVYRGFQPAGCRVLIGTASGRPAPAAVRLTNLAADTRPIGVTLLYIVDDYPSAANTTAGVAEFWRRVAARSIRQVTLLQGAAAAAIYGSRGANGVVFLSGSSSKRR